MPEKRDRDDETLSHKLDSIHPDGSSDEPLDADEVTDVLDLAMERLDGSIAHISDALSRAAERLRGSASAARALTRRLSVPPGRPDDEDKDP